MLEVLFRHLLEPGSGIAGLDGDLGHLRLGLGVGRTGLLLSFLTGLFLCHFLLLLIEE